MTSSSASGGGSPFGLPSLTSVSLPDIGGLAHGSLHLHVILFWEGLQVTWTSADVSATGKAVIDPRTTVAATMRFQWNWLIGLIEGRSLSRARHRQPLRRV